MKLFSKGKMVVLTIIFSSIYIIWRIVRTIPLQYGIVSTICGIILLSVELVGFFEMLVHFGQSINIIKPKCPKADTADFPDVDVFISTYNEPPELLYKTINGCLHMDYPDKSKVHIYLCDDGHREEMGVLARHMGVTHLVRDTHEFAKAGNLNYALSVTHSPYIVTLDADMIPKHDFLTACIPYFLGKEKIGFLQTPQTFYNPDLFQYNLYSENRFPNEQDYFYRNVLLMRNASNTVIYGGTNTILSRRALEDVGGFYTGVVTEDFATGMMIESKGYQCYAINDSHACGLSPEDLKSLIKQRQRWARGCIQTGKKVHLLSVKGLSFRQKVSYLTSITYWYGPLKRFVYLLSPILYAVFNVIVVKCTLFEVLLFWLPMYILNNITLGLFSGNIRNTRLTNMYETIFVPSLLGPVILESIGISQKKFNVTKKDGKEKLKGNGKWYQFKNSILLLIFFVMTLFGLGQCVYETFSKGSLSYVVIMFWLLVNSYDLLMSLFFMYGRRHHRQFERFNAQVDCVISYGNRIIRTKTNSISENGISVLLNFPEYISPEENVEICLATDRYQTRWSGKVANVMAVNDKWQYGFEMTGITEINKCEMLQIVYDRSPSLPQECNNNLSVVDDVTVNIWRRNNDVYFSRKLPRITLCNYLHASDGQKLLLRDFNYEFSTIRFLHGHKAPEKLELFADNIMIRCTLKNKRSRFGTCYRIDNPEEFINSVKFRYILKSWICDSEISADENISYYKKVAGSLKKYETFNELEYL